MCITHGATTSKDSGYIEEKPKKHVERVSRAEFEKGDPDFVDERKTDLPKKKKRWLSWLLD